MCKTQCEINEVCVLKEKSYQLNVRYVYIFEHDFHDCHTFYTFCKKCDGWGEFSFKQTNTLLAVSHTSTYLREALQIF